MHYFVETYYTVDGERKLYGVNVIYKLGRAKQYVLNILSKIYCHLY